MKTNILNLIKASATNEKEYETLENIFDFYEQLQYSTNLEEASNDIYTWLNKYYNVDNVTISLFDINKNNKEEIFIKGEQFFLDDDLSFFFIINTHTSLNATVSFCATSNVHFQIIQSQYNNIEAAFFIISPIIQNYILKKNFIESVSLDSVTNVYNRNFLIENLNTHLRLSNNNENEIYFLMIGIDHYKAVIDEFNYDIGDKLLIELAKIIHSNINEFDMVARLNADEFLVSMINGGNEYQATNIAKKIISDFANLEMIVDKETNQILKKTICIGLEVHKTNSNISLTDSIKNTDIALYEAKNKGRSQLFKYSELEDENTLELF